MPVWLPRVVTRPSSPDAGAANQRREALRPHGSELPEAPAYITPSFRAGGWVAHLPRSRAHRCSSSGPAAALRLPRCHRVPAIHSSKQERGNLAGEPESDAGDARTDAGPRGSMAWNARRR